MSSGFPAVECERKSGSEEFLGSGPVKGTLLEFWQWAYSDLLGNTNRARLAEFIVARALGLGVTDVRTEWDAFDLITPSGVKVEVKSAAYVQSWFQKKLSEICFVVSPRRAWSAKTNLMESLPRRHADVYVLALLAHQEKGTVNPLDVQQWEFYVLPTSALDSRKRSQYSITLKSLRTICTRSLRISELHDAVEQAGTHITS